MRVPCFNIIILKIEILKIVLLATELLALRLDEQKNLRMWLSFYYMHAAT